MSFVKSLFGTVITQDGSFSEGKVGFTESDHLYDDLQAQGKVKLFATKAEAEAFKFKSSMQLFHESYKSLNPVEGEPPVNPTLDFEKSAPIIIDGVPSNYIKEEVVIKTEIVKPLVDEPVKLLVDVKTEVKPLVDEKK